MFVHELVIGHRQTLNGPNYEIKGQISPEDIAHFEEIIRRLPRNNASTI
jgi:hypothetical protein